MDDVYYMLARPAKAELKVKGSRFLAECETVESAERALEYLESVRKREHAATHHCYAYTAGLFDETEFKYSDDGEPSGTAGRPIYDILTGQHLSNCIVVVTRYFGGTKLGTGGLVRAYGDAARAALAQAGKKENYLVAVLDVEIDFSWYDLLVKTMSRHEARQIDAQFTDRVNVAIEVRQSKADELENDIIQLSGGKAVLGRRPPKEDNPA